MMLRSHPRQSLPLPARRFFVLRSAPGAFTLVEVLVAVGLVVLIMSMFATIFSIATGSMSRQKGIAENDQRSRMLTVLIQSDLRSRTFKDLVPWDSTDDPNVAPFASMVRDGYFSISENDPDNGLDDVLSFTVEVPSDTPLYGRAVLLNPDGSGYNDYQYLRRNPNQPEADDGQISANGAGSSDYAEVCYFVRNGNLYRRVMLIRKPLESTYGDQPADNTPANLIADEYDPSDFQGSTVTGYFWYDFDYSAFCYYDSNMPPGFNLWFHGEQSLKNSATSSNTVDISGNTVPISLGIPHLRFGHSVESTAGRPREFVNSGTDFIGRFTHEETSNTNFNYPGKTSGLGGSNPYTKALTLDSNGAVSDYAEGSRQGEDLLLTNVHAFDILVWDPAADVGPDGQPGRAGVDDDNDDGDFDYTTSLDAAPTTPPTVPGHVFGENGWENTDDGSWKNIGHFGVGFYGDEDDNGNGSLDTGEDLNGNGVLDTTQNTSYSPHGHNRFDTWHPALTTANGFGVAPFRPVQRSGAGTMTSPYVDTPQALRAIQIRIRYLDVSSQLTRDLTIIESLK